MPVPEPLHRFARKPARAEPKASSNCVIYTRVSTKEQAENNLSLATQRRACLEYAQRHGLTVLEAFGGTYESAQSDERKEFRRMLTYLKNARLPVRYVVVYSTDRFSRSGPNAIYITHELRQQGILVQSVTQPVDASSPTGSFQQNIQFLFSEYDNELRRQKIKAGIVECLRQGYLPHKPPRGYLSIYREGQRSIEFSADAPLLREAFQWKAQGLGLFEIAQRLALRGLKLWPQKLAEILVNPYYCGYIAHSALQGELIRGKHPPLVPQEVFLAANDPARQRPQGWVKNTHQERYPLKQFLKDQASGKSFAGYRVKAKGIDYYKVNHKGACVNRRADVLHRKFLELLGQYRLEPAYREPLKHALLAVCEEMDRSRTEDLRRLADQAKALARKLEQLEERYVEGELTQELYHKHAARLGGELTQLHQQQQTLQQKVSNLPALLDWALEMAQNMPEMWLQGDYQTRQDLQYLLFPQGLWYQAETDTYRTPSVNAVFEVTRLLSAGYETEASPANSQNEPNSRVVHP